MNYVERLAARTREVDSFLCVGLDPDFHEHRVDEIAPYLRDIIAATAPFVATYKPNVAFYEQHGIEGLRQLEQVLDAIPDGIPVIGDAKRGDIGNTAEAYARALFEQWRFDAVTVNPYLGSDAVAPFAAYEDRGIYVLCRTSNRGAAAFQNLMVGERTLYEHVAVEATSWAPNIGLVVGATAPDELRRIRAIVPGATLLIPGVGAQGGDPAEAMRAAGSEPGSVVVSASRSVLYASRASGGDPATAAATAASELRAALNAPTLG
jgi:orotidine-5'-phosphate decarboxylase